MLNTNFLFLQNIITGDINGLIRCFHIRNMPSPAFLQVIVIKHII